MTALTFLAEWALRSALIIVAIALGLKLARVRNASVRLAAWTAVLIGSLLIPSLTSVVPDLSFRVTSLPVPAVAASNASAGMTLTPAEIEQPRASFPWTWFAIGIYLAGAGVLLLRLISGMVLSSRIVGRSVDTGRRLASGSAIRESTEMVAPATLGVISPVVLVPSDWQEWDGAKWTTVLAHEESHIQRRDPLWQFLSAVHRSLLWFTPASWLLHSQLIRVAEEASDDAALAAADDRASYAEVLLHFLERAAEPTRWAGVAMARYGKAEQRIHRILESTRISRGITRFGWSVTVAVAAPVVLLAVAVHPVRTQGFLSIALAEMPMVQSSASASGSVGAGTSQSARGTRVQRNNRYLIVTGNSMSGSFSSDDRLPLEQWKSKYGPNFVWFRQDGTDYLVTDASVMTELNDAMAPQREVNRMQSEVNQQQGEVNRHQGTVNEHQGRVNKAQGEVNRMQQEVNRGASGGQDRVNAAQSDVNAQQQEVNGEQSVVNGEQSLVNKEQDKVNAEQRRIGPGVEAAIHSVLDSAVLKGLAHGIQR